MSLARIAFHLLASWAHARISAVHLWLADFHVAQAKKHERAIMGGADVPKA